MVFASFDETAYRPSIPGCICCLDRYQTSQFWPGTHTDQCTGQLTGMASPPSSVFFSGEAPPPICSSSVQSPVSSSRSFAGCLFFSNSRHHLLRSPPEDLTASNQNQRLLLAPQSRRSKSKSSGPLSPSSSLVLAERHSRHLSHQESQISAAISQISTPSRVLLLLAVRNISRLLRPRPLSLLHRKLHQSEATPSIAVQSHAGSSSTPPEIADGNQRNPNCFDPIAASDPDPTRVQTHNPAPGSAWFYCSNQAAPRHTANQKLDQQLRLNQI